MKIALIQLNTIVGDIQGNLQKILKFIDQAKKAGAHLVCFQEMALVGYPPRDLLEMPQIVDRCAEALKTIAVAANGIAVVVGTVERNEDPVGHSLFNSAAWCENGQIRAMFRKSLLPTYDVFDERRYFEPGTNKNTLSYKDHLFGVTICEDIWNDPQSFERKFYPFDPVSELVGEGCKIVINISASPYSIGKIHKRLEILSHLSKKHQATFIYVNQVGGNDELIFDGGSMIVDPTGELLVRAPFFKEGVTLVNLAEPNKTGAPTPSNLDLLRGALICGLRDYVKKCGFKKVTLGLSGGIDSALTAYIASKALGPRNVLGLIMPSRYSSRGSIVDALKLAKNLKISVKKVPINTIHQSYERIFKQLFRNKKSDTTEENIQARIRGNLLMAVSNKFGHLVLSTGNKSELAVGYCTLYGDMSGGLAVISDLPKTLVYDLCSFINQKKEVIPKEIMIKPPSAELKPNQTDQDSLPEYAVLDGIIKSYVEDLKGVDEIIKMGFKAETVKRIIQLIRQNEYKRRQAAPGLKVTSKAFGMGRRFPIVCKM